MLRACCVETVRSHRSTWTKTEMVTSVVAALANEWSELRWGEARGNLARVVSDVVQLEASGARMQLFFSSPPSWNWQGVRLHKSNSCATGWVVMFLSFCSLCRHSSRNESSK